MNSRLLLVPDDNLASIILKLEADDFNTLIETYSSLKSNEKLWKKVIYMSKNKDLILGFNTSFNSYNQLVNNMIWIAIFNESFFTSVRLKILIQNLSKYLFDTYISKDIKYKNTVSKTSLEKIMNYEFYKFIYDEGYDPFVCQEIYISTGLERYLYSKINNKDFTIDLIYFSLPIKIYTCNLQKRSLHT